ncbi:transposase [Oceanisphaera litoralis]|uniref:transposase n=1 Tax=Oceanisphaera litoralis TaxID=225144 RepID=UPI001957AEC6
MARLRGKARADKIELLYCDESGFSCVPNVQRAWAPLGVTHLADASVSRKRVNVMGALNYATGKLHFELFEHSVKRQHVVPFLDKLAQSSCQDKLTIVVVDNASIVSG